LISRRVQSFPQPRASQGSPNRSSWSTRRMRTRLFGVSEFFGNNKSAQSRYRRYRTFFSSVEFRRLVATAILRGLCKSLTIFVERSHFTRLFSVPKGSLFNENALPFARPESTQRADCHAPHTNRTHQPGLGACQGRELTQQ